MHAIKRNEFGYRAERSWNAPVSTERFKSERTLLLTVSEVVKMTKRSRDVSGTPIIVMTRQFLMLEFLGTVVRWQPIRSCITHKTLSDQIQAEITNLASLFPRRRILY